jgi:hypothetical protein
LNEKVSVTVNGKPATFFLGLSVRHAIGSRQARAVKQGRAEVRNAEGNVVGLDGALYDGEALVVHKLASSADKAAARPRRRKLQPEPRVSAQRDHASVSIQEEAKGA